MQKVKMGQLPRKGLVGGFLWRVSLSSEDWISEGALSGVGAKGRGGERVSYRIVLVVSPTSLRRRRQQMQAVPRRTRPRPGRAADALVPGRCQCSIKRNSEERQPLRLVCGL